MITHLDASPIREIYIRVLVLVLTIAGIALEKPRVKSRIILGAITISVFLFFYTIARPYELIYYLTGYCIFIVAFYLFGYFIIKNHHIVELLDIYENIYVIICLVTLFFWIFGSILHIVPYLADMGYTFDKHHYITHNYFFLYFENPVQNVEQVVFGSSIARNCGIYCEVPAFAGRLLYAIAIEVFAHPKVNKKKLAVLLVTILSTQSAKALVVLIITFGVMYLLENNNRLSKSKFLLKIIGTIIGGIVMSMAAVYLFEAKTAGTSYLARANIMQAAIKTWLQYPIFGAGFNNLDAIIINENLGHGYGGISMGLMVLLACGGLYFVAFYLCAITLGFLGISRDNRTKYVCVVVMMLINVFISNSIYQYPYLLMVSLLFALYSTRNKNLKST